MKFNEWTQLPAGFTEARATDLLDFSRYPILLHLRGQKAQPLFISILLHGNEDTGLRALQRVLKKYAGRPLPRALSVFIGNVEAARAGVRRLDSQPDYNRVWPGTQQAGSAEAELMASVVRRMQFLRPFAFIDIHNNTGKNPFYACVTDLDSRNLYLARLFSRLAVYFTTPRGTAAAALAAICPSITIECGKAGSPAGDEHAAQLIEAALHLDHIATTGHALDDLEIYHTIATVKVREGSSLAFGDGTADVRFPAHFEDLNFTELKAGTVFAHSGAADLPLIVTAEDGAETETRFMKQVGQEIRLARNVMPAMITLDERIIRQDCLCYLMERLAPTNLQKGATGRDGD